MVRGLDKFKAYFEKHTGSYIIIGGTACDIIIAEAGFTPRATKDIDIILVVEALSADFVKQFWQFIKDGNYEKQEKSSTQKKYYRFLKPENKEFPHQVELFSRKPDMVLLNEPAHLTSIPMDDDLSSLSAILLSDDYYNYIINHSTLNNGVHIANTEALICLKAKAFLEMTDRKAKGENIDEKQIRKHKTDVFRLVPLLTSSSEFELPEAIKADMQEFVNTVASDLPGNNIFKEMGLANIGVEKVFYQVVESFDLKNK